MISRYPCVLLLAGGLALGHAQEGKKDTRAIVQEVDVKNGTITVLLAEAGKSRAERVRTYSIFKPDIPVTDATDKPRKLSDLQEDDRVLLKLMNEDVVAIRLAPPMIHGTLAKVDFKERTLRVHTKIGDKAIVVPASAKIYGKIQPLRFEDLKPGALVSVAFAPDQKTVLEVRTGKSVLPLVRLGKGTGMLLEVDRARHSVQLVSNASAGDVGALRDLLLAKDATFGLLHKAKPFREISFDELGRGVKVQFWTDLDTRKVVHIEIEMPILGRRTVKALDRERRQLTLMDADGDRVLTLAPHVVIQKANRPGKLDEVQSGTAVSCALSPDRKRVKLLILLGQ